MLTPYEQHLALLIDQHINSHHGFAIYRLPFTEEPVVIVQTEGSLFTSRSLKDIDGKDGFIFAPFTMRHGLPLVVVTPQHKAQGIHSIIQMLNALPDSKHRLPSPGLPIHNMSQAEYQLAFNSFQQHINNGTVDKLVLARTQSMVSKVSIGQFFMNACNNYPRMMTYAFYTPITGIWAGSTPEILVDGANGEWTTMALAGTQLYSDSPHWDKKNTEEQNVVETYIRSILSQMGATTEVTPPHTIRAGNLMHLRTDFKFSLPQSVGIGTIISHLHPTPAVCGRPLNVAKEIIDIDEATIRSFYSGLLGPISSNESSHVYVNLRCFSAEPFNNNSATHITLYAGGGIMKDSIAEKEWQETEIKMDTMRNILNC